MTAERWRKRGRRSVTGLGVAIGVGAGRNPIRQRKVFFPFQQILDHVRMIKATWGFGRLIPMTKQGVGKGGVAKWSNRWRRRTQQPHNHTCWFNRSMCSLWSDWVHTTFFRWPKFSCHCTTDYKQLPQRQYKKSKAIRENTLCAHQTWMNTNYAHNAIIFLQQTHPHTHL